LIKNKLDEYISEVSGARDYSAGCKLERGLSLFKKHGSGIMVGDTSHDIEIGKKMGLETVWVSDGHQCETKLSGLECLDYIYDRKKGKISKFST
jgi:phosphoglycolate phosphatase-like HAD superfamily hydrolase